MKNVFPPVHNSFQTAVEVDNYPYGGFRTKMRFWIEYRRNKGFRPVTCSLNPKTGIWNKPHPGNYWQECVMYKNSENGHVEFDMISEYDSDKAESFLDEYLEGIHPEAEYTLNMQAAYFALKSRPELKVFSKEWKMALNTEMINRGKEAPYTD